MTTPAVCISHLRKVYRGGTVAADLFERGLCLPSGTAMSENDLARIVGIIRGLRRLSTTPNLVMQSSK